MSDDPTVGTDHADGAGEGQGENDDSGSAGPGTPLPPPAFPPGARSTTAAGAAGAAGTTPAVTVSAGAGAGAGDGAVPADAFISPDDPIHRKPEALTDDAFISPDAPIPHRDPHAHPVPEEESEGVVVGMDMEEHTHFDHTSDTPGKTNKRGASADAREVAEHLEALAHGLREKGVVSLFVGPETSRFDSLLRGFIAGFLVGKED